MTEPEALKNISDVVASILDGKGLDAPTITSATEMLGGELGIDSLDLASLVSEMERIAGFDPFAKGFIEFRTAGELAALYAR